MRQNHNRCLRVGLPLLAAALLCHGAHADDFASVRYDAATDQLIITMRYSGTNPNHTFSLQWGPCQSIAGQALPEVAVEVLDSQFQDAAQRAFRKTTRFPLGELPCRPAKLTLRTAPHFLYTLLIPAAITAPQ